jgi:ATP phosphoribosyltransferase
VNLGATEIAFAHSRELPQLLVCGALDAVVGPSDAFLEQRITPNVLATTGLFVTSIGLISQPDWERERLEDPSTVVVSQYPVIARRVLRSYASPARLLPISGSAETWLTLGAADAAIDTWRTGAHADAAGLSLVDTFGISALIFASRPDYDPGPSVLETLARVENAMSCSY